MFCISIKIDLHWLWTNKIAYSSLCKAPTFTRLIWYSQLNPYLLLLAIFLEENAKELRSRSQKCSRKHFHSRVCSCNMCRAHQRFKALYYISEYNSPLWTASNIQTFFVTLWSISPVADCLTLIISWFELNYCKRNWSLMFSREATAVSLTSLPD